MYKSLNIGCAILLAGAAGLFGVSPAWAADECSTEPQALWQAVPETEAAALTLAALFVGDGKIEPIDDLINQRAKKPGRIRAAYLLLKGDTYLAQKDTAGRGPEAVKAYKEALAQPDLGEPLRRRAELGLMHVARVDKDRETELKILTELAFDACGSLPADARYGFADRLSERNQKAQALIQIDLALNQNPHPPVDWLELGLELACANGKAEQCAQRLIAVVASPQENPGNAAWLSEYAKKLARLPAASSMLDKARADGWFDEQWNAKLKPLPMLIDPTPLVRVTPEYPKSALYRGTPGIVVVQARIGTDGKVKESWIEWSIPPKVFDAEVLRSLWGWKFSPAIVDGVPHEVVVQQRINFQMQ